MKTPPDFRSTFHSLFNNDDNVAQTKVENINQNVFQFNELKFVCLFCDNIYLISIKYILFYLNCNYCLFFLKKYIVINKD